MITEKVTIQNKLGLHARAASKLVSLASRFESHIELEKNGRKINGKSIMGVIMLAASKGTELTLLVDGKDEKEACDQIRTLINGFFDEEE